MTLPPQFLKNRTIGGMFPEEEGYTTPGALVVHEDRKCFLRGDYGINDIGSVYYTLKVIRRKSGEYAIDISNCGDERWETNSYQGLEVVEIIGYSNKKSEEASPRVTRRKMDLT